MSDETTQVFGELFDTTESDAATDAAQNSSTDNEESVDTEGELDLSKAEEQRNKQIDVWTKRIESGEATIDSLPANLKWLVNPVSERLSAKKPKATEVDLEAIIEQKLAKKEAEQRFKVLQSDLNQAGLSSGQKKLVQSEFNDLVQSGLSPDKALEKAVRLAGVSDKLQDNSKQELRQRMAIPKPGMSDRAGDVTVTDDNYTTLDPNTRKEFLKGLLKSNG